jgi:hypothetical protein
MYLLSEAALLRVRFSSPRLRGVRGGGRTRLLRAQQTLPCMKPTWGLKTGPISCQHLGPVAVQRVALQARLSRPLLPPLGVGCAIALPGAELSRNTLLVAT